MVGEEMLAVRPAPVAQSVPLTVKEPTAATPRSQVSSLAEPVLPRKV